MNLKQSFLVGSLAFLSLAFPPMVDAQCTPRPVRADYGNRREKPEIRSANLSLA